MAERRTEEAIFIPASSGRPLLAPRDLSLEALVHIYAGGKISPGPGGDISVSALPSQFKENTSRRFLCPEIEVSSGDKTSIAPVLKNWLGRTVRDGSLPDTGFEINVSPTQGDLFIRMVTEICDVLKKNRAQITSACGLHVHVDARDYDYMDVRKLVKLYELVEPAIFACLPENRHTSRFCRPCGFRFANHLRAGEDLSVEDVAADGKDKKKYDLKRPIHTMVYGKSGRVERSGKYGTGTAHEIRYMGLNVYSYFFRGSMEFRHAPGSIDSEFIINWAMMCAGLLDTAITLKERSISRMAGSYIKALLQDGKNLYEEAFYPNSNKIKDQQIIVDSTALLKESCQERCWPLIELLQETNKAVVKNATTAQTITVSGISA